MLTINLAIFTLLAVIKDVWSITITPSTEDDFITVDLLDSADVVNNEWKISSTDEVFPDDWLSNLHIHL